MSSNDDMDARHGRMLAELAEAGMGAVRRLSDALHHADNTQDLVLLGEAFHKVSRSVRQTIALEFKLTHAPREPAPPKPEPKPAASPPAERGDRPERTDWHEYERADWDESLDAVLSAGDRDAINEAVDASIARIRGGLAHAECVLDRHQPHGRRPGLGAANPALAKAGDRNLDLLSPRSASSVAALLGSTASHRGPGLRVPRNRDDHGEGNGARPPPWRNSG